MAILNVYLFACWDYDHRLGTDSLRAERRMILANVLVRADKVIK
jgi:hypothetical protein